MDGSRPATVRLLLRLRGEGKGNFTFAGCRSTDEVPGAPA
jgi:hypothetical protein